MGVKTFVNVNVPIMPEEAAEALVSLGFERKRWVQRYSAHTYNCLIEVLRTVGLARKQGKRYRLTRPLEDVAADLRRLAWRSRQLRKAKKNQLSNRSVTVLDSPKLPSGIRMYAKGSRWGAGDLDAEWLTEVTGLRLMYEPRGNPPRELLVYQGRLWDVTDPEHPVEFER